MTNDDPQGFTPAPFPQLQAQFAAEGKGATDPSIKPPKKKGGRRGPRKPKLKVDAPKKKQKRARRVNKAIKNARVRQAAAVAAAPQQAGVKLDLATAMDVFGGMSNDDSKLVSGMVITLAALSKEQRKRILAALARVFA